MKQKKILCVIDEETSKKIDNISCVSGMKKYKIVENAIKNGLKKLESEIKKNS